MAWNLTGNIKGPPGGGAPSAAFRRDDRRLTVSTDLAVVTVDAAADATYNRVYGRTSSTNPPATWPVDNGRGLESAANGFSTASSPVVGGLRPLRFVCDRDSIALNVSGTAGYGFQVYVDGAPLTAAPLTFAATKNQFITIVFSGGHKPRLIEIVADFGLANLYTKKPGKTGPPDPYTGPTVLVIGDSYTAPAVYGDTGTSQANPKNYGAWQGIAPLIGVEEILADGKGGTGYLQANGSPAHPNYRNRLPSLAAFTPDVVIIAGGGSNDLYNGLAVAAIKDQVVATFVDARTQWPNAKLVFVEGFAPPVGFSTFNDEYADISLDARTRLGATGVYYVDVATTDPWINGLGYVTAANADNENSSIYIGSDGIHPTIAGHQFIRARYAAKMRRILRDTGPLLNTLI